MKFCDSYIQFKRRISHAVKVGDVVIGGKHPITLQSMCTTSTMDTLLSVEQIIRIANKGGEIVRLTAQGVSESENLRLIHEELSKRGYAIPLVADIHFNPNAAKVAAKYVEKVRVNPGNFVDKRAKYESYDYTIEEWEAEKERLKIKFKELLDVCVENDTSIRIGVNHGSLSDRIMSKYGDTAKGMSVSAIEMLEMCEEFGFKRVVVSMKSSNTHTMVHAYRMLCVEMDKRGMSYPLHLGVTEAGEGNDGRIRSAVGIGALLSDGIGDTIRVSLTEEPEFEIPVAEKLVNYFNNRDGVVGGVEFDEALYCASEFTARTRVDVDGFGATNEVRAIVSCEKEAKFGTLKPDFTFNNNSDNIAVISSADIGGVDKKFVKINCDELDITLINALKEVQEKVLVLTTSSTHFLGAIRSAVFILASHGITFPIIVKKEYEDSSLEDFQIKVAADFGVLFIDSLCDAMWVEALNISSEQVTDTIFSILQSSRVRITKTEYISCPGCGRTLYALQETLRQIKEATSDFKGVKIAVMGCIVNGPGEMADADYGYVGSGVGVVTLYKGKEVVMRNISENIAVDKLVSFIKSDKKWL